MTPEELRKFYTVGKTGQSPKLRPRTTPKTSKSTTSNTPSISSSTTKQKRRGCCGK